MSEKISSFFQWVSEHKKATIITFVAAITLLLTLFILSKSSSPSPSGKTLSLPERFSSGLENIGSSIGLRPKPTPISEKEMFTLPSSGVTRINFDYAVTNIVDNRITLNGKRGIMVLSKELEKEVLLGGYQQNSKGTVGDLHVGQKVRLDILHGKKAWIYIVSK